MAAKGKTIEITIKNTQQPQTDAKDSEVRIESVVAIAKTISTETEEATVKMKVESISQPQEFLDKVKTRFLEEHIDDVAVRIHATLVI